MSGWRAAMTPRMPWMPCSNCSFVNGFLVSARTALRMTP
jgi:hypothetical protein